MRRTGGTSLRFPLVCAATAALAGLTACGSPAVAPKAAPAPSVTAAGAIITPATLRPGQHVPNPHDKPVLLMSGKIAEHNQGRKLAWDQDTLHQLGLTRVSLYEPWTKKTLDFQGVWLADLLKVAGVPADARAVHMTALDDYQINLTMAEIKAGGIMLATKTGAGQPIAVKDGGPTRIVFANGVPSGKNPDQWIWSLKTLDVT